MRAMAAFVIGMAAWYGLFMGIGIGFGLVWPDYRAAAAQFFATQDFGLFTTPMMLTNFLLFTLAGLATGWLAATISRGRMVALVIAGLLLVLNLGNHYYRLWGMLPDWYNLVVPWVIAGSVCLGLRWSPYSKLASTS